MFLIIRDRPVKACRMSILFYGQRGIKTKSTGIQTITASYIRGITRRSSGKKGHCHRIYIDYRSGGRSACNGKRVDLSRSKASENATIVEEFYDSLTETRQRNSSSDSYILGLPHTFVVIKEEQAILHYGATEAAAKQISNKLRTMECRGVIEPAIGRGHRISVIFEEVATEFVRSALGY